MNEEFRSHHKRGNKKGKKRRSQNEIKAELTLNLSKQGLRRGEVRLAMHACSNGGLSRLYVCLQQTK